MSFFGLNLIGSAVDAFQEAANTTSDNIANINTPGASRQVANLVEAPPVAGSVGYATYAAPTQGDGVLVQSITRIHQNSYDGLFRGATAAQNYFDVEQQQLTNVQSAFGEPNNGINTAFTNLQSALSQLASNASGTSERQGVLAAAQTFASTLNVVGDAVTSAKSSLVQQASTVVSQANGLIDSIAALNGQIRAATAMGDNPNTYEDQRDEDIDQLSQLVSTQTSVQSNGSVLVTVGGQAVVNDTQAYHLAAPVVGTDASGDPALVIGMAGDPNPANPTPVQVGSGQLGAYVDVYNDKLQSYGDQLDAFASATANEIDRITEAGYDGTGDPGIGLFTAASGNATVTASDITVAPTDPSQIVASLASTAAGSLTTAMNSANNVLNTADAIAGNIDLAHPGATVGPTTGTLTVTVDGVAQAFNYDFSAAGNSSTVNGFITSFNAAQMGVTASYDTTTQTIVFARDPNNTSAALRAQQGANPTTPDFTIADSNAPVGGSQGTPTTSILEIVGATGINGVQQNATNAFGPGDNAGSNALLTMFTSNVGIPALQSTSPTAIAGAGSVTVAPPAGNPNAFAQVVVGDQLTIGAGTAAQENVTVTAVDRTTGTITFTAANAHAANFSIASAATQTLGSYYGGLIAQMGNDVQTATTGNSSQTTLASNIDSVRQSVDGINLDEETQNLIKYQNAYQAAAHTMSVLDTLLQTAIGLIPGG